MAYTLEELSDRLELSDLVTRYATCVDSRDFSALDEVFAPDARLDYSASGGPADAYVTVRDWLAEVLPIFAATQHLLSNLEVRVEGDTATGRCMCFNPMVVDGDAGRDVLFYGHWYLLDFVRKPGGWRIRSLAQQKAYDATVRHGE